MQKCLYLLGVGQGVELAIVCFVCAKGEDDNIWFEVLYFFDCPRRLVDEMRKLSTNDPAMVVCNASSNIWDELKSVESEVILIGADFGEGKLKLIGGCCGLIRAYAPAGGVKLTACPLEGVG